MSGRPPALLLVGHGSRDPRHAGTVNTLAARVRSRLAGTVVATGYLEHSAPGVTGALRSLYTAGHRDVVVVPALLSPGYHSIVDLPHRLALAIAALPGLEVRQAPVLGPDPLLLVAVRRLLDRAAVRPGPEAGLVLAAAGSSRTAAAAGVAGTVAALRRCGWGAVVAGYASAARPTVAGAVDGMRDAGFGTVVVASYLLAPGRFDDALRAAGADAVTAPLGEAPAVAALVVRRYLAAATCQPDPPPGVRCSAKPGRGTVSVLPASRM